MYLRFQIEANEIVYQEDQSYYNNICWKLKKPSLGITHLFERYDDVCSIPDVQFGKFENDKFVTLASGYFDKEIDPEKSNCGGVWYHATIECQNLIKDSYVI